ncbi:MAG: YqcC family protein [Pseudomonadales bacterium]|nr:YqcC family protein [Pseudomonadales bacterium]
MNSISEESSPAGFYTGLASLLMDLECAMRNARFWSDVQPDEAALQSVAPFCVDTLDFAQWLQYVFLPRVYNLVEKEQQLPGKCDISPMAEQAFQGMAQTAEVLRVIRAIDEYCSQQ